MFNLPASNTPKFYLYTLYVVIVTLDLFWDVELLELESEDKLQPVSQQTDFFPSHKPLDPMMDLYNGQTFDLKKRVDIWMRMDVIPIE